MHILPQWLALLRREAELFVTAKHAAANKIRGDACSYFHHYQ